MDSKPYLKQMNYYNTLAKFLSYPTKSFGRDLDKAFAEFSKTHPDIAESLLPFMNYVHNTSLEETEEIFNRTFDVQALTTLDIGYVLFGDDYKRGQLLVHLGNEHSAVQNDCYGELADHLPNVLRLLPLLKDEMLRQELVQRIILPALSKMQSEFGEKQISAKEKVYKKHHTLLIEKSDDYYLVYRCVLAAIYQTLTLDFGEEWVDENLPRSNGFTQSASAELTIESDIVQKSTL